MKHYVWGGGGGGGREVHHSLSELLANGVACDCLHYIGRLVQQLH